MSVELRWEVLRKAYGTDKPPEGVAIMPVPESRYAEVLDHVTPIFLREEPLSRCFPPCTTGRREADFRAYAATQLASGLCVMAVEERDGRVVGACLNRQLSRAEVMAHRPHALAARSQDDSDVFMDNVVDLLYSVHQKLDLFTALDTDTLIEIGLVSVEPTHVGRGLATRMSKASLVLGATKGFTAAKTDATGTASARALQKAGMTPVYKLPYKDYLVDGKIVFGNTGSMNPALTVLAAKLQNQDPYVLPVDIHVE